MNTRLRRLRALVLPIFVSACVASFAATPAHAGDPQHVAKIRESVAFNQKLGAQLDRELTFLDEAGHEVKLGDFLHEKPVILAPVYYGCPMLCTQVLNGLVDALRDVTLTLGTDYEIVTFSINPKEVPELATQKRTAYLDRLGVAAETRGWHFLTASPRNALPATAEGEAKNSAIDALTSAIGFRYAWDPEIEQYAHAGGVVVLTPEGKVSKYLYGIDPSPRDVRLALVEASAGKVGTIADQLTLWLCYHYDPLTGKYSFAILNMLRAVAALFALALVTFVSWMLLRERAVARLVAQR